MGSLEKTQVMVYFSLTADDFPLEAVSKRMGIEPTKSHRKGDLIRKISETETHSRSYSSWELCTGYQESVDAGEQINQVIRQLKDKEKIINGLKSDFGLACRFTIVIIMNNGNTPALYLDVPVIDFASRIQADFDIDLYANPYEEELDE